MTLLSEIRSSEWSMSLTGVGEVVQGLDDIRQCIYILLSTRKGTDPLRPDFGVGVHDYIDKPVNFAIPNMSRAIAEAIEKYEPRVETVAIKSKIDGAAITFNITWKLINSVETGQTDITYGLTNT